MTIQSGLPQSMSSRAQVFVCVLGLSLVMAAIFTGFDASVATARSKIDPPGQLVNRAQKGNRLPLLPTSDLNVVSQRLKIPVPRVPFQESKLADGCVPIVSFLMHSELARIAGRCVS